MTQDKLFYRNVNFFFLLQYKYYYHLFWYRRITRIPHLNFKTNNNFCNPNLTQLLHVISLFDHRVLIHWQADWFLEAHFYLKIPLTHKMLFKLPFWRLINQRNVVTLYLIMSHVSYLIRINQKYSFIMASMNLKTMFGMVKKYFKISMLYHQTTSN